MSITNIKKVSQMFLVGIPNKKYILNVLLLIKNYSIGGVIINKNCYDNAEELKDLVTKIYNANKRNKTPLFIAIKEEGGSYSNLPEEFIKIPNPSKMGKKDDELIKKYSYATCDNLSTLGINMNLSIVLDLKNKDKSYTSNYRRICEIYDDLLPGYKKYKVLPVIKHFPGHSDLNCHSRFFFPILKNYPTKDLTPFEHAINKKCDAIMLGHIIIKGKSKLKPITFSKEFIENEIRNNYKYKGLIITNELDISPIRKRYGRQKAIINAVKAGNDLICIRYHNNLIEKTINKLDKQINKGKLNIEDNYNRIVSIKEKYELSNSIDLNNVNIEKYNRQIEKLNNIK